MPVPLHYRSHPITAWATVGTVTVLLLTGCHTTTPDPFASPACAQLPAAAVRAAAADLGTVPAGSPRTGLDGSENGTLAATMTGPVRTYRCWWPSATTSGATALQITVDRQGTRAVPGLLAQAMAQPGPLLVASLPGRGRAMTYAGAGEARWGCGAVFLAVSISHPRHPDDPARDAKTLTEALIPLVGCPGAATASPSAGGSGSTATSSASGTP